MTDALENTIRETVDRKEALPQAFITPARSPRFRTPLFSAWAKRKVLNERRCNHCRVIRSWGSPG